MPGKTGSSALANTRSSGNGLIQQAERLDPLSLRSTLIRTIELKKKGTGPLYYNGYLTTFTLEKFIKRAGLELKVNRKYYKLVRREATERPFTSPLNDEKRPGTFCCAGCGSRRLAYRRIGVR